MRGRSGRTSTTQTTGANLAMVHWCREAIGAIDRVAAAERCSPWPRTRPVALARERLRSSLVQVLGPASQAHPCAHHFHMAGNTGCSPPHHSTPAEICHNHRSHMFTIPAMFLWCESFLRYI